jgi:hypothetical protein
VWLARQMSDRVSHDAHLAGLRGHSAAMMTVRLLGMPVRGWPKGGGFFVRFALQEGLRSFSGSQRALAHFSLFGRYPATFEENSHSARYFFAQKVR